MNDIITSISTALYIALENFKMADYVMTGIFAMFICATILLFIEVDNRYIKAISNAYFQYFIFLLLTSFVYYLFFYRAGKRDVYTSQVHDLFRYNDLIATRWTIFVNYCLYPEVNSFITAYASVSSVLVIALLAVTLWQKYGKTIQKTIGILLCSILIIYCPALISVSFTLDNIEFSKSNEKSGAVVDYIMDSIGSDSILVPMRTYNSMMRIGRTCGTYVMNDETSIYDCTNQIRANSIRYILFDTENKKYNEKQILSKYPYKKIGNIERYVLLRYTLN